MSYIKIPYEKVKSGDEIYIHAVTVTSLEKGDQCYVDFSKCPNNGDNGVNDDKEGILKLMTVEEIWHTDLKFVERPRSYFANQITMYLLRKFQKKPNLIRF